MIGAAVNSVARRVGLEIRRREAPRRRTLADGLRQARDTGLAPATVFDIGAASGTPALVTAFPSAHHVMIEPLAEHQATLLQLARRLASAEVLPVALDERFGRRTLFVPPDLARASLRLERDFSPRDVRTRDIPCAPLDAMVTDRRWRAPFLLKLDVQGAELDVLRGARRVLRQAAYVVLEASLYDFYHGGPLIGDCVTFMRESGFDVYDVMDPQYRPYDRALAQVDLAFVPSGGPLRAVHRFARPGGADA